MAIQGLSERTRYVRIGRFKIGQKETVTRNGRTFDKPVALDYFRIVEGEQPVHELYGLKPQQVLVYLPDNLSTAAWDNFYKRYARSGLMCKGDGITGNEVQADGSLKPRDCAERGCPFAQPTQKGDKTEAAACRPIGTLSFKVVGIPSVGVYQLDTKGMAGVARMDSYLRQLQQAAGGDLAGVPFLLTVTVGKGKDGFPNSRIELRDAPETAEVLRDPSKRLTSPTQAQQVRGYIITNPEGEVIASPELETEQDATVYDTYAQLVDFAIRENYLSTEAADRARVQLMTLSSLPEAEVLGAIEKLQAHIDKVKQAKSGTLDAGRRSRLAQMFNNVGWVETLEGGKHKRHKVADTVRYAVYGWMLDRDEPVTGEQIPPEAFEALRGQLEGFTAWLESKGKGLDGLEVAKALFDEWNAGGLMWASETE
jgi:hypothetical protein